MKHTNTVQFYSYIGFSLNTFTLLQKLRKTMTVFYLTFTTILYGKQFIYNLRLYGWNGANILFCITCMHIYKSQRQDILSANLGEKNWFWKSGPTDQFLCKLPNSTKIVNGTHKFVLDSLYSRIILGLFTTPGIFRRNKIKSYICWKKILNFNDIRKS